MASYIALVLTLLLVAGCSTAHHKTPVTEVQNVSYKPVSAPQPVSVPIATSFTWPIKGQIISTFGDRSDDFRNKGIDIKAPAGDIVRAAAEGKVVYCDSKMRGFGETVILDHGNSIQTVYSYNSDILVKVGDIVQKNDAIAHIGSTGRAKEPSLHFEIRKDGEPVDPLLVLR